MPESFENGKTYQIDIVHKKDNLQGVIKKAGSLCKIKLEEMTSSELKELLGDLEKRHLASLEKFQDLLKKKDEQLVSVFDKTKKLETKITKIEMMLKTKNTEQIHINSKNSCSIF